MHIDGDIVPSERVIAGLDTDPQIIHDIRPQNEVILGISGNSRFFNYYFRCYPSRGTELDELESYVSCASGGKFTSVCHHGCDQPCPVEFVLFLFINFLRTIEFLHPEFRKKKPCAILISLLSSIFISSEPVPPAPRFKEVVFWL